MSKSCIAILRGAAYETKFVEEHTHTNGHIPGAAYRDSYVHRHHLAFRQEKANYPLPTITANVSNLCILKMFFFFVVVGGGGTDIKSARRSFLFWVSDLKSCLMKDVIELAQIGVLLSRSQASIRQLAFFRQFVYWTAQCICESGVSLIFCPYLFVVIIMRLSYPVIFVQVHHNTGRRKCNQYLPPHS